MDSFEEKVLKKYRIVAIVGMSPDPDRPSYRVARYLDSKGYEIIPVNPNVGEILGKKSYPDLSSIPGPVEVVDIFRESRKVSPIVNEAIEKGAGAIWMQEGVINKKAAAKARDAGLLVVMDKCMFKEHQRLNKETEQ